MFLPMWRYTHLSRLPSILIPYFSLFFLLKSTRVKEPVAGVGTVAVAVARLNRGWMGRCLPITRLRESPRWAKAGKGRASGDESECECDRYSERKREWQRKPTRVGETFLLIQIISPLSEGRSVRKWMAGMLAFNVYIYYKGVFSFVCMRIERGNC